MLAGSCQVVEIVNNLTVKIYIITTSTAVYFDITQKWVLYMKKEEAVDNTIVDIHSCSTPWVLFQSLMSIFLSCPVLIRLSWPWLGVWTNGESQPHHISHFPFPMNELMSYGWGWKERSTAGARHWALEVNYSILDLLVLECMSGHKSGKSLVKTYQAYLCGQWLPV